MEARVGVMELMVSVNDVAAKMAAMPMPTPTTPVSSGRPAAMKEPKVMISTRAATAMPSSSARKDISPIWKTLPE